MAAARLSKAQSDITTICPDTSPPIPDSDASARNGVHWGDLDEAIAKAVDWLFGNQQPEGFWVGMLESNSCMEAEWVLAMHFLGIKDDPKYDKVICGILNEQRPDGSWEVYHGAEQGDINTTVECYAALRSSGLDANEPRLAGAREWILTNGGLKSIRNFTKYWLALIGEWPWEGTPTLPPEIILLPTWAPFNVYRFASWARSTIVPLSIISSRRPMRPLPPGCRLDELFPLGREAFDFSLPPIKRPVSWEALFYRLDRIMCGYGRLPIKPFRETAIKICLEWIIRHQESDGAWCGIQPPWIYSLIALHLEGYSLEHPLVKGGLRAFDQHWSYERDGGLYLQASESPVWDTVLSLTALLDCGEDIEAGRPFSTALAWLLDRQVRTPGDWFVRVSGPSGGGWSFQRANDFYPDIDDTAVILSLLGRLQGVGAERERIKAAVDLAVEWILAMQCSNGGWAAFDKDNSHELLTRIPFCDFGELLDPPSVDVTAHVVEALAILGCKMSDPAISVALKYIRGEQEPEGSWFGRWGVNHIYGTSAVLTCLRAVGEQMSSDYVLLASDWLAERQNVDGGWGESPVSYLDASLRGVGDSTASQTAWAIMGLLATDAARYRSSVERGVSFLLSKQEDGTWNEPEYTGTGFPGYGVGERVDQEKISHLGQGAELQRGFMINYNLYRHYFPLMALGRARRYLRGRK
ncbi:MAG: squalene--hopene cyclase [Syntrophobacteraceae bacterium]